MQLNHPHIHKPTPVPAPPSLRDTPQVVIDQTEMSLGTQTQVESEGFTGLNLGLSLDLVGPTWTPKTTFTKGDRVYWHDPDDEVCSGPGTISLLQILDDGMVLPDTRIVVQMDDGSEVEAFPRELENLRDNPLPPTATETSILRDCWIAHGTRTFGLSEAICPGYLPKTIAQSLDALAEKGLIRPLVDGADKRLGWTVTQDGEAFCLQCREAENAPFGVMTVQRFAGLSLPAQEVFLGAYAEQFTRKVEDPKLAFLEDRLSRAGIPHVRFGESMHAPILWIAKGRSQEAWALLHEAVMTHDPRTRFGAVLLHDGDEASADAFHEGFGVEYAPHDYFG